MTNDKYIQLVKDANSVTGDVLKAEFKLSAEEKNKIEKREKQYSAAMRKMGCYTLKKIDPGYGASIHYSGTLPFSNSNDKFTLKQNGELNGAKNVFVADGSGFTYLPAKGITLSIMAYAHLTALNALKN
jgi:hypothetical protein